MPKYWIIAPYKYDPAKPDQWERVWQYDLENNVISIGWGQLGDVSNFDQEQLKTAVAQTYPDREKQIQSTLVNTLWDFYHTISPGDIVIARKGTKRVAAVGIVTRTGYYSQNENEWPGPPDDPHRNYLGVHWLDAPRDKEFADPQFGIQTITRNSKMQFSKLIGAALYLNGVFETVLNEILIVQEKQPELICYLQPYTPKKIAGLEELPPTPERPMRLYISTTGNLEQVTYHAELVGWRDKQVIPADELEKLNEHIQRFQPKEEGIYQEHQGKPCKNLLFIRSLERLRHPFPVGRLIKISDGQSYKTRSQAGGWSSVIELPDWMGSLPTRDELEAQLAVEIKEAQKLSPEERLAKLAIAPKIPEKVQVVTVAFRRNPHVVAAVLERAGGICELCGATAPFRRKSDGTPYLEVHHKDPLAEDGEDTVDNAMAVCPNCHRCLHYGEWCGEESIE
jgi:5-methylcytosine-specific restriction enzyme A